MKIIINLFVLILLLTNIKGAVNPFNKFMSVNDGVDLYSGASCFTLPLVTLPGPAGFDVNLSLNYSSNIAANVQLDNLYHTTSIAGLGWCFTSSKIVSKHNGTRTFEDDEYAFLDKLGIRHKIFKCDGEFLIEGRPYWKLERIEGNSSLIIGWIITQENGKTIIYGDILGAHAPRYSTWYTYCTGDVVGESFNSTTTLYPWQWDLSVEIDNFGNKIFYKYTKDDKYVWTNSQGGAPVAYTSASYLKQIITANSDIVDLSYSEKASYEYPDYVNQYVPIMIYIQTKYLQNISVYNNFNNETWDIDFLHSLHSIDGSDDKSKRYLTSIHIQNNDDFKAVDFGYYLDDGQNDNKDYPFGLMRNISNQGGDNLQLSYTPIDLNNIRKNVDIDNSFYTANQSYEIAAGSFDNNCNLSVVYSGNKIWVQEWNGHAWDRSEIWDYEVSMNDIDQVECGDDYILIYSSNYVYIMSFSNGHWGQSAIWGEFLGNVEIAITAADDYFLATSENTMWVGGKVGVEWQKSNLWNVPIGQGGGNKAYCPKSTEYIVVNSDNDINIYSYNIITSQWESCYWTKTYSQGFTIDKICPLNNNIIIFYSSDATGEQCFDLVASDLYDNSNWSVIMNEVYVGGGEYKIKYSNTIFSLIFDDHISIYKMNRSSSTIFPRNWTATPLFYPRSGAGVLDIYLNDDYYIIIDDINYFLSSCYKGNWNINRPVNGAGIGDTVILAENQFLITNKSCDEYEYIQIFTLDFEHNRYTLGYCKDEAVAGHTVRINGASGGGSLSLLVNKYLLNQNSTTDVYTLNCRGKESYLTEYSNYFVIAKRSIDNSARPFNVKYSFANGLYDPMTGSVRFNTAKIYTGNGYEHTDLYFFNDLEVNGQNNIINYTNMDGLNYKSDFFNCKNFQYKSTENSYIVYHNPDWPLSMTINRLVTATTNSYFDNGYSLSESKSIIEYNEDNGLPKLTQLNTSKGNEIVRNVYAYEETGYDPADDPGMGVNDRHMLSQLGRVYIFKDYEDAGNVKSAVITTWRYDPVAESPVPDQTYSWCVNPDNTGNYPSLQNFILYEDNPQWKLTSGTTQYYPNGCIKSVTTLSGLQTNYIINYHVSNITPIATIVNAASTENIFEGFEGYSDVAELTDWYNAGRNDIELSFENPHTGVASLELRSTIDGNSLDDCISASFQVEDLNLNNTYKFSVWVKANEIDDSLEIELMYSDASNKVRIGKTQLQSDQVGKWTLMELTVDFSEIPMPNDITDIELIIRHNGPNALVYNIDDIRFHPTDALMKTINFTKGRITSVTDANNVSLYYQYYGNNRLNVITDKKNSFYSATSITTK